MPLVSCIMYILSTVMIQIDASGVELKDEVYYTKK